VKLMLLGEATPRTMQRQPDTDDYSDVYSLSVSGDQHLAKYQFLINGQTVRDPYGVMLDPTTGANMVIDLSKTEPASGWAPTPPLVNREDAIIYEVDVHDFTIDPSADVSAPNRGKFLGMVEHNTTIQKSATQKVATGIDHLVALGVTHVQILPISISDRARLSLRRIRLIATTGATIRRITTFQKLITRRIRTTQWGGSGN
jgi:pullulanase